MELVAVLEEEENEDAPDDEDDDDDDEKGIRKLTKAIIEAIRELMKAFREFMKAIVGLPFVSKLQEGLISLDSREHIPSKLRLMNKLFLSKRLGVSWFRQGSKTRRSRNDPAEIPS